MGALENQLWENETKKSLICLYVIALGTIRELRAEIALLKPQENKMPLIACQVMKDNRMQCSNAAVARFNTVPYCLLHLNEKMNDQIVAKTLVTNDEFELINNTDENKAQLTKIIDFTNTAITNAT